MLLLSAYTALQLILVSIGLEIELSINSIPFTTNEVNPFVKNLLQKIYPVLLE